MTRTVFIRVLSATDKRSALLSLTTRAGEGRFDVDPEVFREIPSSPLAYWVPDGVRSLFGKLDPFESAGRVVKQGLATTDDGRFLRTWWEVEPQRLGVTSWAQFARSGEMAPFYGPSFVVINWFKNGGELKALVTGRYGNSGKRIYNENWYFRKGFCWPLRGSRFTAKAVGPGSIFGIASKMAFVASEDECYYLALFNSAAFDAMLRIQAGSVSGVQYEAGLVARTPVPRAALSDRDVLKRLARSAWRLCRRLDVSTETSHAFMLPAVLLVDGENLASRSLAAYTRARQMSEELAAISGELDDLCFSLYDINRDDRAAIIAASGASKADTSDNDDADDAYEYVGGRGDAADFAQSLTSWCVGVAFGRFDLRLATGARSDFEDAEPFAPLSACSPATLLGVEGLPTVSTPAGYPISTPPDGVLIDDAGHPRDLLASVRQVFDVAFKDSAERWQTDVAEAVGVAAHDLRRWFAEHFFEFHLKRYSTSGRKAPIYWQLSIPSRRYSIWLYAHGVSDDTFYRLEREILAPKLAHEERKLTTLVQDGGPTPTARERKAIEAQEQFAAELRSIMAEVRLVKQLWKPNLDDGIVLVSAPLWRLTLHKAWQKELKEKWDDLCVGKYDWAHIAMHLWPERVVPKCAIDRSLAIAHGLEQTFWSEVDGKWRPRDVPQAEMDRLIALRTSEAVKQARQEFLNAPAPGGTAKRGRSTSRRNRQSEAAE
ncbi:MAG: hypothetical protein JOZ54_18575 [Acidobacteria bacterium]|nr:hypothetical protein [Acidobacteriota bacterium]